MHFMRKHLPRNGLPALLAISMSDVLRILAPPVDCIFRGWCRGTVACMQQPRHGRTRRQQGSVHAPHRLPWQTANRIVRCDIPPPLLLSSTLPPACLSACIPTPPTLPPTPTHHLNTHVLSILPQWRFVQKGRRLLGDHSDGPMNIEELLQKLGVARDAQAAAGAHSTSSSGSGSNTTKPGSAPAPGAPGSGTARSRARQQQQEQQQQQQQQHSQQKRPLHSPARGRPADGARMGGSSNHQKQQQQRQHDVDHQDKHQNSQQYAQHGNNSHHSSPTGKDDSNSTAFHSGVWQESVPTGFLWCDECHTMHPDPNCDPSDPPDPSEAADEAAESEARDTERTRGTL